MSRYVIDFSATQPQILNKYVVLKNGLHQPSHRYLPPLIFYLELCKQKYEVFALAKWKVG